MLCDGVRVWLMLCFWMQGMTRMLLGLCVVVFCNRVRGFCFVFKGGGFHCFTRETWAVVLCDGVRV